jgi:ADP-heptose:LPS heptosyltransferase
MSGVLVARLDNLGDVLLAGPCVRAVAASGVPVTFLAGPRGAAAAELLPGVDEVLIFDAPWVADDAPPVDPAAIGRLVHDIAARCIDSALVLTSFHQSPLPLALVLRLAGVRTIGATCADFPGSLLDVRHPVLDGVHEVEQALAVSAALGHHLPPLDDGALRLREPLPPSPVPRPYVVVHPGASVPARALPRSAAAQLVDRLVADGVGVVVTGGPGDDARVASVAGPPGRRGVLALAGRLTLRELAGVLADASAVVCGNTGPAHLAAAVGTPVVQVFAPVVAVERWRPWRVPSIVLGDHTVPCAGCRARSCPLEGQPCIAAVTAEDLLAAVRSFVAAASSPAVVA